jgi:hypothetical protein
MASTFAAEPAYKHDESDVIYAPVTAGQTFKKGALCVLSAGAMVECGANPAQIHGLALADASVALDSRGSIWGGTNAPFIMLQPDMVLKMSSTTTPVFATHVGTGTVYGTTKSSGGFWQLDISKSGTFGTPANGRFVVVGLSPVQGVLAAGQPEFFLVKLLPQFNVFSGIVS